MRESVFFNAVDRAWGNVTDDNLALMQEATSHVKWLRDTLVGKSMIKAILRRLVKKTASWFN